MQRGCLGECGLDFDQNGPCSLEASGEAPDYFRCPTAKRMQAALNAGRWHISFESPETGAETFGDWLRKNQR